MIVEISIEIGKRCVVIDGTGGVMRVRELGIPDIRTVDLKLRLSPGSTDEIRNRSAVRAEELDGMVERKLLDGGIGLNGLLRLSDEHVLGSRGKSRALIGIEVDELSMDLVRVAGERGTPRDSNFDVMVL